MPNMDPAKLTQRIKEVMIDELMLEMTPDEIADDAVIFGGDGLGLDSVDALQLVVALDKHFGLKLGEPEAARAVLQSVGTIAAEIGKSTAP
jgi:acyl carrier protein